MYFIVSQLCSKYETWLSCLPVFFVLEAKLLSKLKIHHSFLLSSLAFVLQCTPSNLRRSKGVSPRPVPILTLLLCKNIFVVVYLCWWGKHKCRQWYSTARPGSLTIPLMAQFFYLVPLNSIGKFAEERAGTKDDIWVHMDRWKLSIPHCPAG